MEKNKELIDKERKDKIVDGMEKGLVHTYPDELFDALRPYSVAGFPAGIMLFNNVQCNGHCYDRAMIMQLAFEDCKVVYADIESLRGNEKGLSPEHAFVETTEFGGNKTWVVDTSVGLIFEKDYYYKFEQPKVNAVFSKEECMNHPTVISILANDFEKDKYALPLTMPIIESAIKSNNHIGTVLYRDKVLEELEKFKTAIGYDAINEEIEQDLVYFRTDPNKLDEKFGIERDKYGREISRNGVPNPYYVTPEECEKSMEYYNSIKDDEEKLSEYFSGIAQKVHQEFEEEQAQLHKLAQIRKDEIKENPTSNFYETGSAVFVGVSTGNISQSVEQ